MSYDNDPEVLARTKFPDYTDAQRVTIVEIAREMARKDGGGIAILPKITVEALLNQADRAFTAAAKVKGDAPWTGAELDYIRDAKGMLSKKAVLAQGATPAATRAAFIKKWGLEKYQAELVKWGATTDVRVPGISPYKNIKGLKKALRGERDLEPTEHNLNFSADRVKLPPKVKPTREQLASNPFSAAGWNLTKQSQLFRLDENLCRSMAAVCGVKIGATKPNL